MLETLLRFPDHNLFFSQHSTFMYPIISFFQIPPSLKGSFLESPQLFINFYNFVFDCSLYSDDEITDELLALQTSVSQFIVMAVEQLHVLNGLLELCMGTPR